jgi:hypothetical protein
VPGFGDQVDPAWLPMPINMPITFTARRLAVAGSLSDLNIIGLVTGSADFALTWVVADIDVDGHPATSSAGDRLASATVLTFALTNPALVLGRSDFGVTINAGTLAIAAVTAPTPASGADSRRWIAVNGTGLGVSLDLAGLVTADVQAGTGSIRVNKAQGVRSDTATRRAATRCMPRRWTGRRHSISTMMQSSAKPRTIASIPVRRCRRR